MQEPVGQITWIGKDGSGSYVGEMKKAVFLLSEDGKEVAHIVLDCADEEDYDFGLQLSKISDDLYGGSWAYKRESEQPDVKGQISCTLLNGDETHAKLLSRSPWVTPDDEWEYNLTVQLNSFQRLPYSEWAE